MDGIWVLTHEDKAKPIPLHGIQPTVQQLDHNPLWVLVLSLLEYQRRESNPHDLAVTGF